MRHVAVVSSAAAGAAFLAACGSSGAVSVATSTASSISSSAPAQVSTSSTATSTPPPVSTSSTATSSPPPVRATGPSVTTASSSRGTILVDAAGRTLYLFGKDTAGMSTCSGQCAVFWPPLIGSQPQAAGGVAASKLTTITRADGSSQVAYNGHPLYYFKNDMQTGDTKGEGATAFGGTWYVVGPSGDML